MNLKKAYNSSRPYIPNKTLYLCTNKNCRNFTKYVSVISFGKTKGYKIYCECCGVLLEEIQQ